MTVLGWQGHRGAGGQDDGGREQWRKAKLDHVRVSNCNGDVGVMRPAKHKGSPGLLFDQPPGTVARPHRLPSWGALHYRVVLTLRRGCQGTLGGEFTYAGRGHVPGPRLKPNEEKT